MSVSNKKETTRERNQNHSESEPVETLRKEKTTKEKKWWVGYGQKKKKGFLMDGEGAIKEKRN